MQLQTTSPERKFLNEYSDVIFIQIDQHYFEKVIVKIQRGPDFMNHGVKNGVYGSTEGTFFITCGASEMSPSNDIHAQIMKFLCATKDVNSFYHVRLTITLLCKALLYTADWSAS